MIYRWFVDFRFILCSYLFIFFSAITLIYIYIFVCICMFHIHRHVYNLNLLQIYLSTFLSLMLLYVWVSMSWVFLVWTKHPRKFPLVLVKRAICSLDVFSKIWKKIKIEEYDYCSCAFFRLYIYIFFQIFNFFFSFPVKHPLVCAWKLLIMMKSSVKSLLLLKL